jgi:glyoxylase-like metal-dependent hydrolase (beta-lactamase superfamily II)
MPESARRWMGVDVPPPPPVDAPLSDGDDLEVAGLSLHVVHVPGHTPGSVSLYAPRAGLLFSGDTLFRGSIGRTDLPGGDPGRIMQSILSKLLALPDETRVLPGHMQETTIGAERAENPFILQALHGRNPR